MREQMSSAGINYISHQNDGDEMAQQYESVFTDMAYQAFNTRFPEQAPSVTTFQVVISDIDEGSAVGAFVLEIAGDIYHVPVVMSDNKIKPMDMVYSKAMDKFFPFTPEWLDVIQSTSLGEEGEVVHARDMGLTSPYDVTQMLQPPTAAYRGGLGLSPTGMSQMPGMNTVASTGEYKDLPTFTDFLKVASNNTKEKFLEMLKGNEGIFKFAAEKFDMGLLKVALQKEEKQTSAADIERDVDDKEQDLRVLDLNDPIAKIKEVFKGSPVKAMEEMATRGFAAKDKRKELNKVYDTETPSVLEEITKSGFYSIYKRDGSVKTALVICNLIPKHGPYTGHYDSDDCCVVEEAKPSRSNKKRVDKLVLFEDKSCFKTDKPIAANPIIPTGDSKTAFDKLITLTTPKKKDPITFIKAVKDTFVGVEPFYVDRVVMDKSGTTRYCELEPYYYEDNSSRDKALYSSDIGKKESYGRDQVAILPSLPTAAKPFYSEDRSTLFLEKGFVAVVLGETADFKDFILDPESILYSLKNRAYAANARDIKVASRGGDDYSVNNKPTGSIKETVEKVARDNHVPFEVVYEKVASLRNRGDNVKLLVVPFEKKASIFLGTPGTQVSPEMIQEQSQEQQMPQQMPQQYEIPQQPQSYMDPTLMEAGTGMQNPELYNLGAIQSIAEDPQVMEMMQEYTPALEKAMDHAARLLLTLWTEGGKHQEDLGVMKFKELEGSARNAFKELGKLLLLVTRHPGEIA